MSLYLDPFATYDLQTQSPIAPWTPTVAEVNAGGMASSGGGLGGFVDGVLGVFTNIVSKPKESIQLAADVASAVNQFKAMQWDAGSLVKSMTGAGQASAPTVATPTIQPAGQTSTTVSMPAVSGASTQTIVLVGVGVAALVLLLRRS